MRRTKPTLVKSKGADFIEYEREKYQRDILVFSIVIFEWLATIQNTTEIQDALHTSNSGGGRHS
jgi:hypothetical protein